MIIKLAVTECMKHFSGDGQRQDLFRRRRRFPGDPLEGATRRHRRCRRQSGQDQEGRALHHADVHPVAVAVLAHVAAPSLRHQGQGNEIPAAISRKSSFSPLVDDS